MSANSYGNGRGNEKEDFNIVGRSFLFKTVARIVISDDSTYELVSQSCIPPISTTSEAPNFLGYGKKQYLVDISKSSGVFTSSL